MAASASISKTIYLGSFVHSKSLTELDICDKGAILVDEQGVIAHIERHSDLESVQKKHGDWKDAKVVQIKGYGFFFPGFIDTHTHAPQHPNTGLFGKTTLLDWLKTYTFPTESSLSSLSVAKRVYSNFVSRTLSHGTTTAAYYATIHVPATNLLADICLKRGQRALVGRVCMDTMSPDDYRDESVESAIRDSKESIEYIRSVDPSGEIVRPVVTPRFAPSCTTPCLSALGHLAKETDSFVQTHISENKGEIELVQKLFPDSKHYTDVYDTAGLLGEKTILAHAIHLSDDEIATIKATGSKISHCPASNTAITSGVAPIRTYLAHSLPIGLGTDISGGFSPSILEECRQAIWASRFLAMYSPHSPNDPTDRSHFKLSTEEALYLATRGGAEVVGLSSRVGGFEVGMEWDAQMICLGSGVDDEGCDDGEFTGAQVGSDIGQVDVFGKESAQELVEKWVYSGDDRNCAAVLKYEH